MYSLDINVSTTPIRTIPLPSIERILSPKPAHIHRPCPTICTSVLQAPFNVLICAMSF